MHALTSTYTLLYSHTRTYIHIHAFTFTYTHLHSHTRIYIHIHAFTFTYTHLHPRTRAYTQPLHVLTRTYTFARARAGDSSLALWAPLPSCEGCTCPPGRRVLTDRQRSHIPCGLSGFPCSLRNVRVPMFPADCQRSHVPADCQVSHTDRQDCMQNGRALGASIFVFCYFVIFFASFSPAPSLLIYLLFFSVAQNMSFVELFVCSWLSLMAKKQQALYVYIFWLDSFPYFNRSEVIWNSLYLSAPYASTGSKRKEMRKPEKQTVSSDSDSCAICIRWGLHSKKLLLWIRCPSHTYRAWVRIGRDCLFFRSPHLLPLTTSRSLRSRAP